MPSYILSKCELSLHCGWACAFSDMQLDQMTCCIGHKRIVFLCCGLACGYSDVLLDQRRWIVEKKIIWSIQLEHCDHDDQYWKNIKVWEAVQVSGISRTESEKHEKLGGDITTLWNFNPLPPSSISSSFHYDYHYQRLYQQQIFLVIRTALVQASIQDIVVNFYRDVGFVVNFDRDVGFVVKAFCLD